MYHHLASSGYGKSRIRLVKVTRRGDRHDVKDVSVDIRFEGDYEPSFVVGDNASVLPTDTMRNTVYAIAAERGLETVEAFALDLASHFLDTSAALSRVTIDVKERPWRRIAVGEKPHGQAFLRPGGEHRLVSVEAARGSRRLTAGIGDLVVLKTARSAFAGFLKDKYTTLGETRDRLFATSMRATWTYDDVEQPYDPLWKSIRQLLLEVFAQHDSLSVQHTLYAMADVVLQNYGQVGEVSISMPNLHHLSVDLEPFGLENRNEILLPTEEPHGLIEATVRRRREE